jgi:hypothetical protein
MIAISISSQKEDKEDACIVNSSERLTRNDSKYRERM